MLKARLNTLLQSTPDLEGVAVVGADGLPLDSAMQGGLDGSALGAEFADFVKGLHGRLADAKMGTLNGLTVETDGHRIVIEPVAPGYFMLGVVRATGLLGRARFALRRSVHEIAAELA